MIKEILTKAAEILEQPDAWTQGNYARDSDGSGIDHTSPQAVCFCSVGALRRAASNLGLWTRYLLAHDVLAKSLDANPINWNDTPGRTQAEVVAAFRKAAQDASV